MHPQDFTSSFIQITERDLNKLIFEIESYPEEDQLWIIKGNISNSAGNLDLHLAGSTHFFIGAVIGQNGYVRTRDKEFSDKHVPRVELIQQIRTAINIIKIVIPTLQETDLATPFPEKIAGNTISTNFFLLHFISHVNYHVGQVNYHRRLIIE